MKTIGIFNLGSIALSILALLGSSDIQAQSDTWKLLDTRGVDYSIDYDVIEVNQTYIFTALKIKVKEGKVNVHKATIHFANGDKQDIDLPNLLTEANDGKTIKLDGNERVINKIGFWYDTNSKSDLRGVVEVWGKN